MVRMSMGRRCVCLLIAAWIGSSVFGCVGQITERALFQPMRSMLRMKEPIRIAVTRPHVNPLVPPPWTPLAHALREKLDRPVQIIGYRPFQVRSLMEGGYVDFALLSATDYVEVGGAANCILVAQPVNALGQDHHAGLIVTRRGSQVAEIQELKGQRFAFGPARDSITHWAAADALLRAGIGPKDITLEMLPLPMTRRHHLDSYEVAKAVVYEALPAGVVDELDYVSWPESGGTIILQSISRDQLRVIGRTAEVPEGPIVASRKADPALVAELKEQLLGDTIDAAALAPMHWTRFKPVEEAAYAPVATMVEALYAAGWMEHEITPDAPASEPAVADTTQAE